MGIKYRGRCYHCCRTTELSPVNDNYYCKRRIENNTLSYRRTNEDLLIYAIIIFLILI